MNELNIIYALIFQTGDVSRHKYSLIISFSNRNRREEVVITQFWKDVEAELDETSHRELAVRVRGLVEGNAKRYEKKLVLIDRYKLIDATKRQNQLIRAVISGFANDNRYAPTSVHQTLLVFLRDWFVACNLADSLLTFLDTNVQVLQRRQGWAAMQIDRRLLVTLMEAFDRFTNLERDAYSMLMSMQLQPWMTNNITEMQFYKACKSLREIVIVDEQKYTGLFCSVNWYGMQQELQRELGGERP